MFFSIHGGIFIFCSLHLDLQLPCQQRTIKFRIQLKQATKRTRFQKGLFLVFWKILLIDRPDTIDKYLLSAGS